MAGFNFIEAAGKGYKFTWDERVTLFHYGFWPMMLKVSSFVIITGLELDKNMLRQGLVMLPAYFLEGWLVAVAIRFAMFGERRPEPLNNNDPSPEAAHRRRCILGGIIIYLLIKLVTAFVAGVMVASGNFETNVEPVNPSPGLFFVMLVAMGLGLWFFRLLWLHVPVIMGYPVRRFLWQIRGLGSSFNMLALWMLCMVPVALLLLGVIKTLMLFVPVAEGAAPSLFYMCTLAALQGVMETVVAVVANVAMAYAVREVITRGGRAAMKIFLTDLAGKKHTLDAIEGWRVMEIVRDHGFPMKAECGGACACATCHVYIADSWIARLAPRSAEEDAMLDEAFDLRENSRLSCQIIMSAALDGLEVFLAENPD